MPFDDFAVDPRCLALLEKQGLVDPTPIQERVIPVALTGQDVVALAQTGTGKTLAYVLPCLTRLAAGTVTRNMMLVLVPTRELAGQVHGVIEPFAQRLGMRAACLYGGVRLDRQTRALRRGCAVIVATPGRLLDHMGRGSVSFRRLAIFVLDEADRMLDMGFLPDIQRVVRKLPEDRQTIMCSATFPDEVARFANTMQRTPERISVGAVAKPVETVEQTLYTVDRANKLGLLCQILREKDIRSALVFLRTKARTDRVTRALRKAGLKAQAIHGDRSQRQRQQALDEFRQGRFHVLVATDVAARGLDIEGVSHIINFDIPENPDDYIHRIGRTARAGAEGDAITFVCPDELLALEALERALGRTLPRTQWEGAVPVLSLYESPEQQPARHVRGTVVRRRRSLLRRR